MRPKKAPSVVPVLLILLPAMAFAVQPERIAAPIDSTQMVMLRNHVSPMAQQQYDQGPVEPSRSFNITMLFVPTAAQEQAILKLLDDQQNPKSANYHKWLTPEQYGERFGLSQGDIDKISAWLTGQGFKITYLARGRDFLSFQGNAVQVQSVFKTEIHNYIVEGKTHFANSTSPSIPVALSRIVGGFRGLHDFFPHSMLKPHRDYTLAGQANHYLAPGDIATIYDISPLYQGSPVIDGTGQSVVIAGQSDVYLADLNDFRSAFGLPTITGCATNANGVITTACNTADFQMVVPGDGSNPKPVPGDLSESDLDIEWMNSVARGAKIIFVTSGSNGGVDDSASWAIDNNLAPVISYSYGLCEAFVTAPAISTAEATYQKAATEGISFFAAAGDSGAAECDGDNSNDGPAVLGLSVSYPASSVNVTGVGGTEFNEGTGSFWNATNGANGGSATGYIPELAWNDTTLSFKNGTGPDATGGGPSNCASGSGTTSVSGPGGPFQFETCNAPPNGGFPKPAWQVGITPSDSVRDVPDISFSASNVNDPYIVCTPLSEVVSGSNSSTSTCATSISNALMLNPPSAFGGTSAATPVAAGIAVLLNQFLGKRFGPINQQLYTVYKSSPTVFHDIVAGMNSTTGDTSNNIVPCTPNTPTFEPAALRCPSGGNMGFSAGHGYDTVTGLGSLDVHAFFQTFAASQNFKFSLSATPATLAVQPGQTANNTVNLTVTDPQNTGFIVNNQTVLPVTYTCAVSPAVPEGPTCTFSPSAGQNVTVTNPTVAIVTTAPTARLLRPLERRPAILYAMLLPGIFGIVWASGVSNKKRPRSLRLLGLIVFLGFSMLWLPACGGSSNSLKNPGTPAGNYSVTVNATTGGSSPINASTTFTVTVQ